MDVQLILHHDDPPAAQRDTHDDRSSTHFIFNAIQIPLPSTQCQSHNDTRMPNMIMFTNDTQRASYLCY